MQKIVKIHAVYREWPVLLVAQTDTGDLIEISLKEVKERGYEFDEQAWKELVEEYRVFNHSYQ